MVFSIVLELDFALIVNRNVKLVTNAPILVHSMYDIIMFNHTTWNFSIDLQYKFVYLNMESEEGTCTQFRLNDRVHTTYYNRFFALRALVIANDQTVEISMSDKNVLQLSSRYPEARVSFDSVVVLVDEIIRQHGVSGISRAWCENKALIFDLIVRPGDNLSKLLRTSDELQTKLTAKVEAMLSQEVSEGELPPLMSVDVHTELYLVTPNPANKSIHLVLVAADNLLRCLDLWRESPVFDFGAAFTAYRTEPNQEENEGMFFFK